MDTHMRACVHRRTSATNIRTDNASTTRSTTRTIHGGESSGASCGTVFAPMVMCGRILSAIAAGRAFSYRVGGEIDEFGRYTTRRAGLLADRRDDEDALRPARAQVAQDNERLRVARVLPRRPRDQLDRSARAAHADQPRDFPSRSRP